jgi:hypothetical protein
MVAGNDIYDGAVGKHHELAAAMEELADWYNIKCGYRKFIFF